MGYGFGVFAKLENSFNEAPAAKRILPYVSGALLLVGLIVMFASLSGGGTTPQVVTVAPTVDLEKALAAAKSYLSEQESKTFEGFDDPRVAEGVEPTLDWNKAEVAVEGEISIRSANPNKVLLVTRSQGGLYCVAASDKGEVVKGRADAAKSEECVGGW